MCKRINYFNGFFVTAVAIAAIFIATIVPAKAITIEDIAARSEGEFYVEDGKLATRSYAPNVDESYAIKDVNRAIAASTRVCDKHEAINYAQYIVEDDASYHYLLLPEEVDVIVSRCNYVNEWLAKNMPTIVPAGTSREDAIRIVNNHIANNYKYDKSIVGTSVSADAQGAYYMLVHGSGICASFAKLFCGMIEFLPFDANGVVNYDIDNDEANHIQVAICNDVNYEHEWDAIQDPIDGKWYYYDIASTVTGGEDCYKLTESTYRKQVLKYVVDIPGGYLAPFYFEM